MDVLAASASLVAEPEQPSSTPRSEAQIEVENKFQKAVAVWKGIDLGNLLSQHDTTATDVVAHQKESLVQRKELAQRTKEFRRYDDARKLTEIKGLLKLYQSFVDLLTSHVKTASGSYLQLYTALSEAPDPYPLLEASVDALVLSEHTLPKLTQDKEALEKRVNRLTLQLEATEQKLADEREARRTLEAQRDAQIKGVEKSWEAVLAEKTHNWESKEKEYQEKTVNQERLLKELKATAEVAQKLQQNESDGASGTVSAAE
ncbi:hypothetical protein KEM52_001756 [Ascosphaera acerosa]|nr:hypothetical protein KEM52_001756 [Ascosphaera acerosa]